MRFVFLLSILLFNTKIFCQYDQEYIAKNITVYQKTIDNFIKELPELTLPQLTNYLKKFQFHPSQKNLYISNGVVVSNIEGTPQKNIAKVSIATDTNWSLFCELEYGFANADTLKKIKESYTKTISDERLLHFTHYMDNLSVNYANEYIRSLSFKKNKAHLDSLLNLAKSDSTRAYCYYFLGSIYSQDGYLIPENRAQAFYYFNRGRYYIEDFKQSSGFKSEGVSNYSDTKPQLRFPSLDGLLFYLNIGCATTLHNYTEIDPQNTFYQIVNTRNYYLYLAEKINRMRLEAGKISESGYLYNQHTALRMLTSIRFRELSTIPDTLTERFVTGELMFRRIGLYKKGDEINDFFTLYSIAGFLYNSKQYSQALKIYLYALKFKTENYIPDYLEYYERESMIKKIFECYSHVFVRTEELDTFYQAIQEFMKKYRTDKLLSFYGYHISDYNLGFDELILIHYLRAKNNLTGAKENIELYILKSRNYFLEDFGDLMQRGPFMDNFIEAAAILGKTGRADIYSKYFQNRLSDKAADTFFAAFFQNAGIYNGTTDIVLFIQLFKDVANKINEELYNQLQSHIKEEQKKNKFWRTLAGLSGGLLLIVIGIISTIRIINRTKQRAIKKELLANEEKNNLNLLHRNNIHNWNNDQVLFTNSLYESEIGFITKLNEKHIAYMNKSNQNWVAEEEITLYDALESVRRYYEFLKLLHPLLEYESEIENVNIHEALFIQSIFETALHNSVDKGFGSFENRTKEGIFRIKISRRKDYLYCLIHDNGKPQENESDYFTGPKHGIELIKSRVEFCYKKQGRTDYKKAFSVNILPGKSGTSLRIRIPYEEKTKRTDS